MTVKMSVQKPSLEPHLQSTSSNLSPGTASRSYFEPIVEEHTPVSFDKRHAAVNPSANKVVTVTYLANDASGTSSSNRDEQREESSTIEKSRGASRSWFGGGGRSLRRILGLESSKKRREPKSSGSAVGSSVASTAYSRDHPLLVNGEDRRNSDPVARGPSSGVLSVVNQPRSKSVGAKAGRKGRFFLGLFERKKH
jgi:hypothetical protein